MGWGISFGIDLDRRFFFKFAINITIRGESVNVSKQVSIAVHIAIIMVMRQFSIFDITMYMH